MTVKILIGESNHEVEASGTVAEAVNSLNIRSNAYLYLINNVPVPSDTPLEKGMEIKTLRVASGG